MNIIKPIPEMDTEKEFHFPSAGLDTAGSFAKQPARPVFAGEYARTCASAVNVRGFDQEGILRGGSRTGISRYVAVKPINETWIVQDINVVTGKPYVEGDVQFSQLGRVVTMVAVVKGRIFAANAGDQVWVEATNNTGEVPPLNISGLMASAPNQQKLWFVDGVNAVVYSPVTNSAELWVATAGSFPTDSDENLPRIACTWRGRIVLSGLIKDPQNWFMSAVDGPTDFDYAPLSATPTQAVAGNNSPLGLVGDVITALIPYTDDILIFGGDHTIYIMRGDPMAGGQIDLVSSTIGIAYGEAWCQDPYGNVYFMSNKMGVYTMVPGSQPQRISQAIEESFAELNSGLLSIRLIWDDRYQGLWLFLTPLAEPTETTHYFYELRSSAWWPVKFANNLFNPLCCRTFDGNNSVDRAPLIGSWDGFVRALDPNALDDDGEPINSSVTIGPFATPNMDDLVLRDLQAVLAEASGEVSYEILVGDTAEEALNSSPIDSGTWGAGRNPLSLIQSSGHAIYVRISSSVPWAMESIRMRLAGTGKVRRRS